MLAVLTPAGHAAASEASAALGAVGFGLPGIDDATADRIAEDLRLVRRALGDKQ